MHISHGFQRSSQRLSSLGSSSTTATTGLVFSMINFLPFGAMGDRYSHRSAMRTKSASDAAAIFCITFLRWTCSVTSLISSSDAACLLRGPLTTSGSTSRFRQRQFEITLPSTRSVQPVPIGFSDPRKSPYAPTMRSASAERLVRKSHRTMLDRPYEEGMCHTR